MASSYKIIPNQKNHGRYYKIQPEKVSGPDFAESNRYQENVHTKHCLDKERKAGKCRGARPEKPDEKIYLEVASGALE